jgi:F-type H+-transporting ATPase subunit b
MTVSIPMFALLAAEGGFNPLDVSGGGGFLWTLIIFGVSLPLMWKIVFSKVAGGMRERDERASEAIVAAERASAEAERARAAVEVALGEAKAEAAKLLTQARERAKVREDDILESAKKEAKAMIESASQAIQFEQEKAISAIRAEVVELSLTAATRVLGRKVGSDDDRRLAEELVSSTQKSGL